MKRLALPIFIALLLCGAAFAQTIYTITPGNVDGYYPPYLYEFDLTLSGTGNQIGWVTGAPIREWGCGNGNPSTGGFIDSTLGGVGQPCANSTSYNVGPTISVLESNGKYCNGPDYVIETFDNGATIQVFFTYVLGGRWHNLCQGIVDPADTSTYTTTMTPALFKVLAESKPVRLRNDKIPTYMPTTDVPMGPAKKHKFGCCHVTPNPSANTAPPKHFGCCRVKP